MAQPLPILAALWMSVLFVGIRCAGQQLCANYSRSALCPGAFPGRPRQSGLYNTLVTSHLSLIAE